MHGLTPRAALLAAPLLAWAGACVAATPAARIAAQGNGHGAIACQGCHGADGAGQAATGFPRLAGLDAGYLKAQLDAFADGTRVNAVMQPTAKALDAGERAAMAAYYAQLPAPVEKTPSKAPAADGVGARLALRGRWAQQVPACEQCHGPGGVGVGANFPPLAAQPATYLATQLRAWQQGTRRNDPLQLMQHISKALSEDDITAVSDWFATQPARLPDTPRSARPAGASR